MRRAGMAVLVVAAGLLAPTSAAAYRTAGDLPAFTGTARVRWRTSPRLALHDTGVGRLSLVAAHDALVAALDTWSLPACTSTTIRSGGITAHPARPGDRVNVVQELTADWTLRGFSRDAAATTDVQYVRDAMGQWVLIEVDVYLNGAQHSFGIGGGPSGVQRDLQAVLTHEAGGHALGLLHPCEVGGADGAPDCASDPGFAASAVFPQYLGRSQRVLSADDIAAVCFLYPACEPGGCPLGEACTAEGCKPLCGAAPCEVGAVCSDGVCMPAPCVPGDPGCPLSTCTSDSECSADERCVFGLCGPAGGDLGDPCASAAECSSRECGDDGSCTEPCGARVSCPAGYGCGAGGLCAASSGVFGDPCDVAGDCVSGLCLVDRRSTTTCTRACGGATAPCPGAIVCAAVDGRAVCRPPPHSGCGVAPLGRFAPWHWGLLVVLCGALVRRRT